MKNWRARILSAIIAFTIGTGAVFILRFCFKPAPKSQRVNVAANTAPLSFSHELPAFEQKPEPVKPHPVSISPYEIKHLTDEKTGHNLEPIWEQLGIDKDEDDLHQCYFTCHAEIAELELDSELGKETLLRLSGQPTDRYLVFKRIDFQRDASQTWMFLGYVDAFTRWSDFTYRVETAGTQRWLVITATSGHGSGFSSYSDYWYEVNESGVTQVLSYQRSLFAASWAVYPNRERETKVLKSDFSNGVATVVLQVSTSYRKEDCLLWTNKHQVAFIKGVGMQQFTFDTLHSQIVDKELDPSFGDGVYLTEEELLKYNYRELMRIAVNGSEKQKAWLRAFLGEREESIERRSLQKALEENSRK